MKLLFLTLLDFNTYEERNIYTDLFREFIKNGHEVYCISPVEKRADIQTHFEENGHILKLKIGNIQKTNIIEKGISTLLISTQFINGIKKYFNDIKFDFVFYATPPVTFANVIKYVKKRDGAKAYLMLKDIYPQNAVDLGMMTKTGFKGLLYKYFRNVEKKLYEVSDYIGCMSQANVSYVLNHNSKINKEKVGLCPNCIDIQDVSLTDNERNLMRNKYNIPQDKKVFVYGGNLGRPQDVHYMVECIRECSKLKDVFFVIAGSGTDKYIIEDYISSEKPGNVMLLNHFPKEEYDRMVACCDIGLIFLDHRFTIPNFPSRLLSYLQAKLPVIACTDPNTDIGRVIVDSDIGWWCESNDLKAFYNVVLEVLSCDTYQMRENAFKYLEDNYSSKKVYNNLYKSLQLTEEDDEKRA